MQVLLVNGSSHRDGCTFTALSEVAGALHAEGIETEFLHIGAKPVRGCIGCWQCRKLKTCAFQDELYLEFVEKIRRSQGIVVGSPVYYAGPSGSLCALLDRMFFSAGRDFRGKCAAAVVNCRRGGASAAFDRLNKYFTINDMPVVSSQYWNSTHGFTPDEVRRDLEGLQTMRTLGRNMAYLMKSLAASPSPAPVREAPTMTNFIPPLA